MDEGVSNKHQTKFMVDLPSFVQLPAFFSKGHPRPLFVHFNQFIENKPEDFSGIQTLIVGVEGEHADHLTINTALAKVASKHSFSREVLSLYLDGTFEVGV